MQTNGFIKALVLLIVVILSTPAEAQFYRMKKVNNAFFAILRNDLGFGLRMGYAAYISDIFYVDPQLVYSQGKIVQQVYRNIGFDLGIGSSPFFLGDDKLFLNFKLIAALCYETLKGQLDKQVWNYGGRAGAEIEYFFLENLSLGAYCLQGYLFKKPFHKKDYELGIICKINL